jgi:hypothetical protein
VFSQLNEQKGIKTGAGIIRNMCRAFSGELQGNLILNTGYSKWSCRFR